MDDKVGGVCVWLADDLGILGRLGMGVLIPEEAGSGGHLCEAFVGSGG